MKKLTALVLVVFVIVGLVLAHSSKAYSTGASDADTLRQLERDWADATKAIDVNRIGQIIADDWRAVGSSGKVKSKEILLSDVQTRENRLESFEFGPMDVKLWDNVGVVQGSWTGQVINIKNGQHSDFSSAWMDVCEKRGDKWVVVRSQITRLK